MKNPYQPPALSRQHGKHRHVSANTLTRSRLHYGYTGSVDEESTFSEMMRQKILRVPAAVLHNRQTSQVHGREQG